MANVPIFYPLQTPENQRFSVVFRGCKMGTLARNGLVIEQKWELHFKTVKNDIACKANQSKLMLKGNRVNFIG